MDLSAHPGLVVMAVAVVAPLLAEIPRGFRLPAVVLELVLGLSRADGLLGWLGIHSGWKRYSLWQEWSSPGGQISKAPREVFG